MDVQQGSGNGTQKCLLADAWKDASVLCARELKVPAVAGSLNDDATTTRRGVRLRWGRMAGGRADLELTYFISSEPPGKIVLIKL